MESKTKQDSGSRAIEQAVQPAVLGSWSSLRRNSLPDRIHPHHYMRHEMNEDTETWLYEAVHKQMMTHDFSTRRTQHTRTSREVVRLLHAGRTPESALDDCRQGYIFVQRT